MDKNNSLKKQGIGIIIMLIIEYILGMFTNIYVSFPKGEKGGKLWEFAWKQPALALHIIIGCLLIIAAIVLIIRSIKQKNKYWSMASIVGYIGIQLAFITGAIFIPSQSDIYSYGMSLCFILAFLSYGWGIYKSKTDSL